MGYFYIVLLMFVALSYCYDYKKFTSLKGFWLVVMWITAVCIAAFRYRMGVDSVMYEYEYPEMPTLSQLWDYKFSDSRYQLLYIVFTAISRSLSDDFFCFQILHALYVNTIIFWFYSKYTKHTFFALSLYFLMLYIPFNMEVLRESLAISTFLLAWPMFKNGRWLWYYVICLIALGFHLSAILTFVFPLFRLPGLRQFFVFGKRTIIICFLLFSIGFFIQDRFFDILQGLSMTDNFKERAAAYKGDELGGAALNINGIIGYLIKFACYPLIALYFLKKKRKSGSKDGKVALDKEEYMCMWNVYTTCITLLITIFHRYNNYLAPFTILLIADWAFSSITFGKVVWKYKYYMWVVIFIPLYFIHIYTGFYSALNKSGTLTQGMIYSPYKSRLNPEEDKNREKTYRYINPWRNF